MLLLFFVIADGLVRLLGSMGVPLLDACLLCCQVGIFLTFAFTIFALLCLFFFFVFFLIKSRKGCGYIVISWWHLTMVNMQGGMLMTMTMGIGFGTQVNPQPNQSDQYGSLFLSSP